MFFINNNISTYGISSEIRRSNDLKEKEMKLSQQRHDRNEWLSLLQRATDDAIVSMLANTQQYNAYSNYLRGGQNEILYNLGDTKELNQDYIDIKNECIIRGLI